MTIWIVEDCGNSPGRIYAVFAHEEDAAAFADQLYEACNIVPRTVFYSQPPNRGFNE